MQILRLLIFLDKLNLTERNDIYCTINGQDTFYPKMAFTFSLFSSKYEKVDFPFY